MRLILAVLLTFTSCLLTAAEAAKKVRIACVGDSITYGAGVEKREENSYPVVLERLLAGKATVVNAGRSGATLLKAGDLPYWTTPEFAAAKDAAPQIVVIMLGTNDTKPQNWDAHKGEYAADLTALIDTFRKLPSKPEVWLCLPPPAYQEQWGIRPAVIRDEVLPLVTKVAKENSVPTIDVFAALSNHPELFPDSIHPNAAGAEVLAKTVHTALTATKKAAAK